MKNLFIASLALTLSHAAIADEHNHHQHGEDSHSGHHHASVEAPIGLMGAHLHEEGDWMFSYRYGRMAMEQNRSGTGNVSDADVLASFPVTPTDMEMEMHMFGAMYGVSDDLTLMAMIPYTFRSMNHVTRTGARFRTNTEGFGDARLGALISLWEDHGQSLHLNAGLSLPTGSIDETGRTPLGVVRLPFPMQLGSGTFDFTPSLTYLYESGNWGLGSQLNLTARLGRNSENYSLGNEIGLSGWTGYRFNDLVSATVRLDGRDWGNIDGADSQINPAIVPTARTDLRGGTRVDALIGLDLTIPKAEGQRFAIEVGAPIYEKLDGPQLSSDWRLTAGWQGSF